jgi:hypothetical protein
VSLHCLQIFPFSFCHYSHLAVFSPLCCFGVCESIFSHRGKGNLEKRVVNRPHCWLRRGHHQSKVG